MDLSRIFRHSGDSSVSPDTRTPQSLWVICWSIKMLTNHWYDGSWWLEFPSSSRALKMPLNPWSVSFIICESSFLLCCILGKIESYHECEGRRYKGWSRGTDIFIHPYTNNGFFSSSSLNSAFSFRKKTHRSSWKRWYAAWWYYFNMTTWVW